MCNLMGITGITLESLHQINSNSWFASPRCRVAYAIHLVGLLLCTTRVLHRHRVRQMCVVAGMSFVPIGWKKAPLFCRCFKPCQVLFSVDPAKTMKENPNRVYHQLIQDRARHRRGPLERFGLQRRRGRIGAGRTARLEAPLWARCLGEYQNDDRGADWSDLCSTSPFWCRGNQFLGTRNGILVGDASVFQEFLMFEACSKGWDCFAPVGLCKAPTFWASWRCPAWKQQLIPDW